MRNGEEKTRTDAGFFSQGCQEEYRNPPKNIFFVMKLNFKLHRSVQSLETLVLRIIFKFGPVWHSIKQPLFPGLPDAP